MSDLDRESDYLEAGWQLEKCQYCGSTDIHVLQIGHGEGTESVGFCAKCGLWFGYL